jgi:hypothetical protein
MNKGNINIPLLKNKKERQLQCDVPLGNSSNTHQRQRANPGNRETTANRMDRTKAGVKNYNRKSDGLKPVQKEQLGQLQETSRKKERDTTSNKHCTRPRKDHA